MEKISWFVLQIPPAPYHSVTGMNLYGGGKDGDLVLVVDVNKGEGSPVRQCEVDVVVPELHLKIHQFTFPFVKPSAYPSRNSDMM